MIDWIIFHFYTVMELEESTFDVRKESEASKYDNRCAYLNGK